MEDSPSVVPGGKEGPRELQGHTVEDMRQGFPDKTPQQNDAGNILCLPLPQTN